MDEKQSEAQFISLLYTFHQSAMFALGKMANPLTGKIDKNLIQAKNTIDIIEMLEVKTKGNLSQSEDSFLKNTLQELRLNYVYEADKEKNEKEDKKEKDKNTDKKEDSKKDEK